MTDILIHELAQYPPSLAKANGQMNSSSKSDILSVLSTDIETPHEHDEIPVSDQTPPACILIDGHALIQAKHLVNQITANPSKIMLQSLLGGFAATSKIN